MLARESRSTVAPAEGRYRGLLEVCVLCGRRLEEIGGARIPFHPPADSPLWTPPAIARLERAEDAGLMTWSCQSCVGPQCRECGAPLCRPVGRDVIRADGSVRYHARLPFVPASGCWNPACPNYDPPLPVEDVWVDVVE